MSFEKIFADLKKKQFKSVYFLDGDEPFYIDKISDFIASNALDEGEKEFNQTVVYGRDTNVLDLISTVKRFPMMAAQQVVIVKEAQHLKQIEKLEPLIQQPVDSSIFVICYKGKTLDGRKSFGKLVKKNSIYFSSKKLRDYEIPKWIDSFCKAENYYINPKASVVLAEYLGNDLNKIANELEKLMIVLEPGKEITPALIEKNIGISKDYNIFELQSALGKKDVYKATLIVNYFAQNLKDHSIIPLLFGLYSYFTKIIKYHHVPDKRDKKLLASTLGVHPFFVDDYRDAALNYNRISLVKIISCLREYDVRSKGVDNPSTDHGELMKEMVLRIINS